MKKTIYQLRTVGVFAAITLFAACSKEHTTDVKINPSKYLVFEVGNTDDWDAEHKSNVDKKAADGLSVGNIDGAADCAYADDGVVAMEGMKGENKLYLHTSVSDRIDIARIGAQTPATRNVPVTMDNFYSSFNVYGYAFEGVWSEDNTPSLIDNESVSKIDGIWQTVNPHIWPGEGYVRFYAYAPADLSGLSVSAAKGTPKFSYTVPSDVADQKDLLIAATELEGNGDTPVKLTFRHPLTAVKFVTSANIIGGTINSLSVKNVYGTGTFTPDVSGAGAWSGQSTAVSYSQNLALSVSDGVADQEVAAGAKTFMLMPQTLPDGANITVNFTDSKGDTFDLTASVAGTVWPMGKTVTYSISTANIGGTFVLDVTPTISCEYGGATNLSYTVKSYKEFKSGKIEAAAWTSEYSVDNGTTWSTTKPSWLTTFTGSGNGSTTTAGNTYTAAISAQTGSSGASGFPANPTANYNLSNSTGGDAVQNTANCYIIKSSGTYRLPLVYGNAIKGGTTNSAAYTATSGTNVLATFKDHADANITGPYIYDKYTPANACIVWQDANNLLTEVALSSDKHFLTFTVSAANIKEGNSVVAVRDASNNVLWSWHIWVTNTDLTSKAVTNHQNKTYNMMPVNLGWVSASAGGTTTYAARSCKVRIKQTGTTNVKVMDVLQKGESVTVASTGGCCPYYQWGRKDPMPPSNGEGNTDHTLYNNSYTYTKTNSRVSLGTSIKNPMTFYYYNSSGYVWCSTTYNNLWSAKNTGTTANDDAVTKTVYDPCPVGYHMPASNAFTGFTSTGDNTGTNTQWNVVDTAIATKKGYEFYCKAMVGTTKDPSGGTIFFPAAGYRNGSSGALGSVTTYGCYWAAVPNSATSGRYLGFYSSSVYPLNGSNRANGYCVRPVQE
ncbi:MAG: fimbrillin family protein [Alistipes sp.]|nr:fimbrillin family protein [Alistipes sp.]